ncbi:MAG: BREX protein BrxB domain-containing protein [Spirosomataceae bacterium]
MTITELYQQLANKDFQDYQTGSLFFPAYMYVYDPHQEYEVDQEIMNIKERLHRPTHYLDVLVIDLFQEFQHYLKKEKFGSKPKFDYYLEHEPNKPQQVEHALRQDAYDPRFLRFLDQLIRTHFEQAGNAEVAYVFVKGFGATFPYLRASKFINNFEKYISGYKMILFYPGEVKDYYNLFGLLQDENLYRAIKLINQ